MACKACRNDCDYDVCTDEQWNDPEMHDKCCKDLQSALDCDPCFSKECKKQWLACLKCQQFNPCANEPTENCPGCTASSWCNNYYRRRNAVRFSQPSPRTLCSTCGAHGSGISPCGDLLVACQGGCDWTHRNQSGMRVACRGCCEQHVLACSCTINGVTYVY